jgi:hypothetical protein
MNITRDAIIISGWRWESCNVPERLAVALAHAGKRVLYCENPVSFLRHSARKLTEIQNGIFVFGPKFLGHRLNTFPGLSVLQSRLLVKQIINKVEKLKLRDPVFIYPHGHYSLSLSREFQHRGFRLIHICMDYELPQMIEHVRQSDLTLAIPPIAFSELREKFGKKVQLLPQLFLGGSSKAVINREFKEPVELSRIGRPRLGYLGDLTGRASISLIGEVLASHPEWQFLSFGTHKWLSLANEHVLPWCSHDELSIVARGLNVGFMPYDCADPKNLHCVPLKLFDYFALGLPVVSTPISYLREYEDLVYIGKTAGELADAVARALAEPAESPKRLRRMTVAREHSVKNLSQAIATMLED